LTVHKTILTEEKTAVGYVRLSRTDTKDVVKNSHGASIESSILNQMSIIKDYCRQKKITFDRFYMDKNVSGSEWSKRPGFQQMLEDAKDGCFDLVVVKDADRLSRGDLKRVRKELQASGVKIWSIIDGDFILDPEGELTKSFVTDMYRTSLRKKSCAILKEKVRLQIPYTRPIYGYKTVYEKRKAINWECDTKKSLQVVYAINDFINGKTYNQICDKIGLSLGVVLNIFRRIQIYAGDFYFIKKSYHEDKLLGIEEIHYKCNYQPIIEEATLKKVLALKNNFKRKRLGRPCKNPIKRKVRHITEADVDKRFWM